MKRSQKIAIFCFTVAIIFWIVIAIGDAKYGYPIKYPNIEDKAVDGLGRLGESINQCIFVFDNFEKFSDHVAECENFMHDVGTLLGKLYEKYPDM